MGLVEAFQNKTTAVPGPEIPKIDTKEETSDYYKTEQVLFVFINRAISINEGFLF